MPIGLMQNQQLVQHLCGLRLGVRSSIKLAVRRERLDIRGELRLSCELQYLLVERLPIVLRVDRVPLPTQFLVFRESVAQGVVCVAAAERQRVGILIFAELHDRQGKFRGHIVDKHGGCGPG